MSNSENSYTAMKSKQHARHDGLGVYKLAATATTIYKQQDALQADDEPTNYNKISSLTGWGTNKAV